MATGTAIASIGLGIFQTVKASQEAKDTKKDIHDFRSQDLVNSAKNTALSTLKSDRLRETGERNFATSVDALKRGGTRAIASALPTLNEGNVLLQNLNLEDLSQQDANRDIRIAQGEDEIRRIREGREVAALGGLGQQLQTARQDTQSGINNIFSSGLSLFGEDGGEDIFGANPENQLARRTARENRIALRNS
jgi:hypothetical protein